MNQRLLKILGGKTEHYPYELERTYPRILETILQLWDEDKIDDYFLELMVSNRSDRSGFPGNVAAEIMYLSLVHAAQEPPDQPRDLWEATPDAFVSFTPHPDTEWENPPESIRKELQDLPYSQEGFFEAIESGNRRAVALFLETHINLKILNSRGWTPLMMAAFNGHDDIVNLLIQHHAEVNAIDPGGNSALHWAAFNGYISCVKQLIEQHAPVNAGNRFGWTPLILAAARNHPESAALLIKQGALPNKATEDGYTALHKAAEAGYSEVVKILLDGGADKTLINQHGDTAEQLAKKNKQTEIIKLLTQQA